MTPQRNDRGNKRNVNLDLIRERFEADTANLTGGSFTIDKKRKFSRKITVANALNQVQEDNGEEALNNLAAGYVRRLNRLLGSLPRAHKHWKELKKTATALNIEVAGKWKNEQFIELLARLRALDLFNAPPS